MVCLSTFQILTRSNISYVICNQKHIKDVFECPCYEIGTQKVQIIKMFKNDQKCNCFQGKCGDVYLELFKAQGG